MKHIYFSGISGAAIGPLALIAKKAGYNVSGSDKQDSAYIEYMKSRGIENITVGQTYEAINSLHESKPIDWIVYSSAVSIENPNHPELRFAKDNEITATKRDEFLNMLLQETGQKMIAVAGTHGKTTTTAMLIWLFKQLKIPISYSVGAKLSFGDMGEFDPEAEYFIYEADEYDRNFLSFTPRLSLITGIGYDHPDIYPTQENYNQAFRLFFSQSDSVFIWQEDADRLSVESTEKVGCINKADYPQIATNLPGKVNRQNAALVVQGVYSLDESRNFDELSNIISRFPGVSRRFEKISDNLYSDYAHTPEKILGALQTAAEMSPEVVVVYEGLHNTRQHFIKSELETLFMDAKKLYIVPSYLAREDESLELLTPEKLCEITKNPKQREPSELSDHLKQAITEHVNNNDLVLCLSAGGGGSLDEWLRKEFA